MLAIERRQQILERLYEKKSVTVSELSKKYDVSEETIRRDLQKLEEEGIANRTYGGAYLNGGVHYDLPIEIRETAYVKAKELIGVKCASLINSGDTIILDSSTTSLHIAEHIKRKSNITVITNAIKVASKLAECENIKVLSTGGILRANALSYVGHIAERMLKDFYVDKAFVSCGGIHLERGILDSNELEAEIRKVMLKQAQKKVLIADNTKFDKTSFIKITDFDEIDMVITDKKLSDDWKAKFDKVAIEYCYCEN
ncbi:DeoR/GlpR family DNA-binding transcription regulator [Natronincola peptidivorans]|nr:DeoR/GlpR family DNA-binding transcription regulator [Natronincola peptidivorans]